MADQQPEALRLADVLAAGCTRRKELDEAGNELRRLHARDRAWWAANTEMEVEIADLRAQVERPPAPVAAAPALVPLTDTTVSDLSVTMVKGHKSVEWLCGKLIAEFCRINGLTVGGGGAK